MKETKKKKKKKHQQQQQQQRTREKNKERKEKGAACTVCVDECLYSHKNENTSNIWKFTLFAVYTVHVWVAFNILISVEYCQLHIRIDCVRYSDKCSLANSMKRMVNAHNLTDLNSMNWEIHMKFNSSKSFTSIIESQNNFNEQFSLAMAISAMNSFTVVLVWWRSESLHDTLLIEQMFMIIFARWQLWYCWIVYWIHAYIFLHLHKEGWEFET